MTSIGMSLTQMDNPMAGIDASPELATAAEQGAQLPGVDLLRPLTAPIGDHDAGVPTCTLWAASTNTSSRQPT
jgi:hypothetical protein